MDPSPGASPKATPWYFQTRWFVVALLVVGPLALPLLWWNPHVARQKKLWMTVFVLAVTYALGRVMLSSLESILEYYRQAGLL